MKIGPTGYLVEVEGAAVNATEMTSPVVTLGVEVANPWRARCPKRGTPGSEGGVGKHSVAVRPAPTLPILTSGGLQRAAVTPHH